MKFLEIIQNVANIEWEGIITGLLEGDPRRIRAQRKGTSKNTPERMKDINPQIQETHETPRK